MADGENVRFRVYFDAHHKNDALLKDCITQEHLIKSSAFVEAIARGFGVSPQDIAYPTPYLVRELAEAAAYAEAAKKRSLQNASGNSEGADSFELKRRVYQNQIDKILGRLTAANFLGNAGAKPRQFPMTFSMQRN